VRLKECPAASAGPQALSGVRGRHIRTEAGRQTLKMQGFLARDGRHHGCSGDGQTVNRNFVMGWNVKDLLSPIVWQAGLDLARNSRINQKYVWGGV
jgi:hypothetical protein